MKISTALYVSSFIVFIAAIVVCIKLLIFANRGRSIWSMFNPLTGFYILTTLGGVIRFLAFVFLVLTAFALQIVGLCIDQGVPPWQLKPPKSFMGAVESLPTTYHLPVGEWWRSECFSN
jgi:hypothetical protein